jgi:hypothetical protein
MVSRLNCPDLLKVPRTACFGEPTRQEYLCTLLQSTLVVDKRHLAVAHVAIDIVRSLAKNVAQGVLECLMQGLDGSSLLLLLVAVLRLVAVGLESASIVWAKAATKVNANVKVKVVVIHAQLATVTVARPSAHLLALHLHGGGGKIIIATAIIHVVDTVKSSQPSLVEKVNFFQRNIVVIQVGDGRRGLFLGHLVVSLVVVDVVAVAALLGED